MQRLSKKSQERVNLDVAALKKDRQMVVGSMDSTSIETGGVVSPLKNEKEYHRQDKAKLLIIERLTEYESRRNRRYTTTEAALQSAKGKK